MSAEELYQSIFTRRAVREYDQTPLDDSIISSIREFINQTPSLSGTNFQYDIVSGNDVSDDKAPHYILCYSDGSTPQIINIGYVLDKTDLYSQSQGFSSIWLGMSSPKDKSIKQNFTIMMGFGKTSISKRTLKDFDRLNIKEVSNAENDIANTAHLASSANNSQP
jgi:hypothetical protein